MQHGQDLFGSWIYFWISDCSRCLTGFSSFLMSTCKNRLHESTVGLVIQLSSYQNERFNHSFGNRFASFFCMSDVFIVTLLTDPVVRPLP